MGGLLSFAAPIGNTIGAIGDIAAAFTQKKAAKENLRDGQRLAASQRLDFNQTYGDLTSLLGQQATYKGDTSQYKRAENEAERQQMMAQNVPVSDQLYRDQAGRTSSNTFARGIKGARSGSDLMSLAGMVGDQENQQMQGINLDSANRGQTLQQQANQNRYSSIVQTAAATARERGMEFDSILNKSNAMLDLTKEKGLGAMDMEWNLGQANMAQKGAVANSKAAMWSGIGGIFKAMGGGIAQQQMQDQQMSYLKKQMETPSSTIPYSPFLDLSKFSQPSGDFRFYNNTPTSTPIQQRKIPVDWNNDGTYKFN